MIIEYNFKGKQCINPIFYLNFNNFVYLKFDDFLCIKKVIHYNNIKLTAIKNQFSDHPKKTTLFI